MRGIAIYLADIILDSLGHVSELVARGCIELPFQFSIGLQIIHPRAHIARDRTTGGNG